MAQPIDLFVSLRDLSRRTKSGALRQRFGLRFKAPTLIVDPGSHHLLQPAAEAITKALKDNLRVGKAPDGSPLPALDSDRLERQEFLVEQGRRSGEASPRYKDPKFRARVKRNYQRDFKGLGRVHMPHTKGVRGNVSGLLIESIKTKPVRAGDGFITFVAARRATPRKGESITAIESVFQGIRTWSNRAMKQPEVQAALRDGVRHMVRKRRGELVSQLRNTFSNLRSLAEEAEELGED